MTIKKQDPVDDHVDPNSPRSQKKQSAQPEPKDGMHMDVFDFEEEGKEALGNIAAKDEEDTQELDGSNANNLRTK